MTIGMMVRLMQPWSRIKISTLEQVDIHGERQWTQTLTEAQIYAYWNREIINHYIDEKTLTIYCIVKN